MSDVRIIEAGYIRGKKRKTTLKIGNRYRVAPLNPQKLKHRDRVCTIVSFDDAYFTEKVSVKFHDNRRVGKVDAADLVEELAISSN